MPEIRRFGNVLSLVSWLVLVVGATPSVFGARTSQAIEIRVEVTEVDNAKASKIGVQWMEQMALVESQPPSVFSFGNFGRSPFIADLHFLQESGAARLLANPNLLTDSGTTATFHAGGEIPYVVTTNMGSANVEFKRYGVLLAVEPELVSPGRVRMKVSATVSAPDYSNAVAAGNTSVPSLLERNVVSNVTVSTGTTIALAGLAQTHEEERIQGVPLLKNIPFLGALFRWRQKTSRRTTVVIFVTPQLVAT